MSQLYVKGGFFSNLFCSALHPRSFAWNTIQAHFTKITYALLVTSRFLLEILLLELLKKAIRYGGH